MLHEATRQEHSSKPRRPAPGMNIVCSDPATGQRLGEVAAMAREEVAAVVARARAAQPAWAATSFGERRAVLRDVLEHVVAHQHDICRLAVLESGKTMVDATMGEIFPVCEKLRFTIQHGERALTTRRRRSGFLLHKSARVEYHPLGVVGVICPWNFPFHNLFCPVIPALFAGNAVVAKPSEWSSWSAADFAAIWRDALVRRGHSADLVQIVTGDGETGGHLVGAGVDKVFFTGSPETGRKVMSKAAETLTPVVLELGGKDPMIVCDDANLRQAADAAMLGVFTAAGQMCVGVERVYVFDRVHDAFVARMRERIAGLRQGLPLGPELVDIGATTMPAQLDKIQALVDDALSKGAKALVGGHRRKDQAGQFFEPTLLVDVDHSMRIAREECFGPVLTVIRVADEAELMRLVNATPYGLGASVFSRDQRRANRIASAIRSGMAVVNDYGLAYMVQSLPFGGVGLSGFGRINGPEGLRACCYEHAVVDDRIALGQSVAVHPIRPATLPLIQDAVRLLYGAGVRDRTRALRELVQQLLGSKGRDR
jgi:acyl-CoA reductase-like NAD-dependent aldehyde dehydrogenase